MQVLHKALVDATGGKMATRSFAVNRSDCMPIPSLAEASSSVVQCNEFYTHAGSPVACRVA